MVLPLKDRLDFVDNFTTICKEEGFSKSTWTIDLCYLLRRYNIHHKFYTITLGVHPGYKRHDFYATVLTKDEERINRKFAAAEEYGIVVRKSKITLGQLMIHLAKYRRPIILLTNSKLLACEACKVNKISKELKRCLPWPQSFQGHYIVICGYDKIMRRIYYRNPAFQNR